MELKIYHRTQRELGMTINKIIDAYWNNEIEEKQMIESIKELYNNNAEKLLKNNEFTTIIQQQCGNVNVNPK